MGSYLNFIASSASPDAQRFYYAKPMPVQEYEKFLVSYTADGENYVPETYYSFPIDTNRNGLHEGSRDMLKKLNDVAELLPGGFFVYKADDTEEIISFNQEILKIYGCSTEEEFRELTGNSFRGMVHPDDLTLVQNNISSQIDNWASRNVNLPEIIDYDVEMKLEDILSCCDIGNSHMKTNEGYLTVTYIDVPIYSTNTCFSNRCVINIKILCQLHIIFN